MNFNDLYPSNFLKAGDLQGQARQLQITNMTIEDMGSGEHKPVLHFVGAKKGLVLNKTNGGILASQFSPETDGWMGKTIELYPDKVPFQGQIVDAIRVRVPIPPAQPMAATGANPPLLQATAAAPASPQQPPSVWGQNEAPPMPEPQASSPAATQGGFAGGEDFDDDIPF